MLQLATAVDALPLLQCLKIADVCFEGGRSGARRSQHDEKGYQRLGASTDPSATIEPDLLVYI
jgi:hypothetical protein